MKIVILGLSITSSWGNGHATTYRSLVKGLNKRGHDVLFLERDVPWYANQRDMVSFDYCRVGLYASLPDLRTKFMEEIQAADVVVVGSYIPQGVTVGEWIINTASGITAFYDIDTPVTLAKLEKDDFEYITPGLISRYDLYLSFSGGIVPEIFISEYGAPAAKPLYCSVDPEEYYPERVQKRWDLGYLGTYSTDRQPPLDNLLLQAALQWPRGRFVVAGPSYPSEVVWPENVERFEHLPPPAHRAFYNQQKFTLNITRKDMIRMGYSPSVRLFEAAACGIPVISDYWNGLNDFFEIGKEILVSRSPSESLRYLTEMSEEERMQIGKNAHTKVMAAHTGEKRAAELESYIHEMKDKPLSKKISNDLQ